MKINIVNKSNNPLPKYENPGDAGFDIRSKESKLIFPGETQVISTGLFIETPEGYGLFVFSRSGLASKGIVVGNGVGVVDNSYKGEVKVIIRNENPVTHDNDPTFAFKIAAGDRIAQGVFMPVTQGIFNQVAELTSITERGEKGFGSTGIK